ncbi:hypothetical protein P168DRAFT_279806 [Aspergillus campestris IBT 28561]|uniref:non-specific serine/threonine protein kinase n=1 Tax=Aspergillus campestris (strain IBT 28561) TaxID=1392248 RepID=A0A2I1D905_ASPC2|nr:uncharacterized protein P168DRAFT_279806 [Aspergillus campestris IBT 28561]PKY06361.1 hypothetical protein P168DRAFT_279806 [Aspergillus campestris IBT 28561]
MSYPALSELSKAEPIKDGLDAFRTQSHLPSLSGRDVFRNDLGWLIPDALSNESDISRVLSPLSSVLDNEPDVTIWRKAYSAAINRTPPPRPVVTRNEASSSPTMWPMADSFEYERRADAMLEQELGSMYIDVPGFFDAYLGRAEEVETAAATIMRSFGEDSIYDNSMGWTDWPRAAQKQDVHHWLGQKFFLLRDLATKQNLAVDDKTFVQASQSRCRSAARRQLYVAIATSQIDARKRNARWSDILIPGELDSDSDLDGCSTTWLELGRSVREVFPAQDRRFVLGFTLCGSIMRLWAFDRSGAISSSSFDINEEGLLFVSTMLGFLHMSEKQLGFDPTILKSDAEEKSIAITRNGQVERVVLDEIINQSPRIAGKSDKMLEGPSGRSAQNPHRELLPEVTQKGVVNVARYYHHQEVTINGQVDDIQNIRKGLDVTQGTYYGTNHAQSTNTEGWLLVGSSNRTRDAIWSSGARPRKGARLDSSVHEPKHLPKNRVHRRIFTRDYGKPIYKASSPAVLLRALEQCIEGHQSLYTKAGILHGDISPSNLLINEETNYPYPSFLIGLDLSHREQPSLSPSTTEPRERTRKTGTRPFTAIGLLLNEQPSFHHDLESFFWVLFWICIHHNGTDQNFQPTMFNLWDDDSDSHLAFSKTGIVCNARDFSTIMERHCAPFYRPLIPAAADSGRYHGKVSKPALVERTKTAYNVKTNSGGQGLHCPY